PGSSTFGSGVGVKGISQYNFGYGVWGRNDATVGNAIAVYGSTTAASGIAIYGDGVSGGTFGHSTSSNGTGAGGSCTGYACWGVYGGGGLSGDAGHFEGNVYVSGTLTKAGGSFKIDHPLDPDKKYLYHSFVESPDMMNIYNGMVTLDAKGEAIVTLPEW